MKVVPQGDGTYKRYKADGTEITGTTSKSANTDLIYDGVTSPADFVRVGGGVDTLSDGTPLCIVHLSDRDSPYAITESRLYYWDGDSWEYTVVQNADFPYHSQPKLAVVDDSIYVADIKVVSGVNEIVKYISADGGVSFDGGELITTSSTFGQYNPLVSPGSGGSQNLIWHTRIHRNYSEVNAGTFIPPGTVGVGMFLVWP
jgi:hypothetical protein